MNGNHKPVRIAQMMTDMNFGGVEMVVMNYYRHIDRSRYQFDFFALEGSQVPQREEIESLGGRVYIVPKYTHLNAYIREVTRIFRENQYPIVHSHMNTLSVFSLCAAKKAGVPVRIAHNHSVAGQGETKKNLLKYALRTCATVYPTDLFACSEAAGQWIYGKHKEFTVIHNAIELSRFSYDPAVRDQVRKELGIENSLVIGHIGRFCYAKNHEFLVDIFREVHKKRQDAVLVLVGEGELEQKVREKVDRLGLSDSIRFLGVRRDANRLYQAMDLFLLPSRYEGLPVVGVEAQAAGLPLITTDRVTEETKILPDTQFLSSEAPASDWADVVLNSLSCYDRRDTRIEMQTAGFDIETEAQKLMDRYDSLLMSLSGREQREKAAL